MKQELLETIESQIQNRKESLLSFFEETVIDDSDDLISEGDEDCGWSSFDCGSEEKIQDRIDWLASQHDYLENGDIIIPEELEDYVWNSESIQNEINEYCVKRLIG